MTARQYLWLFLIASALRLVWLALHADADFAAFEQGDYRLYELGAEQIARHGNFNSSIFLVRPPAYPILIHLVGGDKFAVLLVNSLLGATLAPLSARLAVALGLRARLAFWIGVIVCVEPTSLIHSSVTLNAEPLTNLSLLLMLLSLLQGVEANTAKQRYAWLIGAGFWLALSALTRPAGHWLWLALAPALWWYAKRLRRPTVAFLLASVPLLFAWVAHNGLVFGNFTFSSTSSYTMLYYRAAPVERLATGQAIDDVVVAINQRVSARIGEPTEGVGVDRRHHWLAGSPAVYDAMLAESLSIFRRYPLAYLFTIPVGFLRIYGIFSSFPNLGQPLLAFAWLWDIALVLGWSASIWIAWRQRSKKLFWWPMVLVLYFTATTLAVSSASNSSRMTSMVTPLLIIGTVYAMDHFLAGRGFWQRGSP